MVVQNKSELEVLLVEHERVTRKKNLKTYHNVQINHKYKYLKHKYVF